MDCRRECGNLVFAWRKTGLCRDCYDDDRRAAPPERICPGCQQPFTAKPSVRYKGDGSGWTVTCSKSCALKVRIAAGAMGAGSPGSGPRLSPEERATKALAKSRARRLVLNALPWDGVTDWAILERDRWICGICHDPIDQALTYPHPDSRSVDHIVPLSRGGDDTQWNKRAAHLGCNQARGDGHDGDQLVLHYEPGTTPTRARPQWRPCPDCGEPMSRRCKRHKPVRWCDCGQLLRPGSLRCRACRDEPPPPKPEPKRCRVPKCPRTGSFGKGCCAPHFHRLKRYGDVFADIPIADVFNKREVARLIRERLAA